MQGACLRRQFAPQAGQQGTGQHQATALRSLTKASPPSSARELMLCGLSRLPTKLPAEGRIAEPLGTTGACLCPV